jgi:hypothetical protein
MEDSTSVNTSGRPSKEQVLALRMKHFSNSQSVSYLNSGPLMIVKVNTFTCFKMMLGKGFLAFGRSLDATHVWLIVLTLLI